MNVRQRFLENSKCNLKRAGIKAGCRQMRKHTYLKTLVCHFSFFISFPDLGTAYQPYTTQCISNILHSVPVLHYTVYQHYITQCISPTLHSIPLLHYTVYQYDTIQCTSATLHSVSVLHYTVYQHCSLKPPGLGVQILLFLCICLFSHVTEGSSHNPEACS